MSSKKSRRWSVSFPDGDTLSVIFSFLSTLEILRGELYLVNKGWRHVLLNWPNAWGRSLCLARFGPSLEKCSQYLNVWRQIKDVNLHGADAQGGRLRFLSSLNIEKLVLAYCWAVTNSCLEMVRMLPLQHLDLTGCELVTDAGWVHLSKMPLKRLILDSCRTVTDSSLAILSSLSLEYLDLSNCIQVTDAGLAHLSSMPLKHLDLYNCDNVTDAGVMHLVSCPLESLDLFGCYRVTTIAVDAISERNRRVRVRRYRY